MNTCKSCGDWKPMNARSCPTCYARDPEAAFREDRKDARKSLLWATLWLAGAVYIVVIGGNPFRGLSLIWAGQPAVAHHKETNDEEVEDDSGRGKIVAIHTYAFTANGTQYCVYSSSSDLREHESVKYLPDDPSIALVDGDGRDSATSQVLVLVIRNLAILSLPLIVSIFFARHGLRVLKEIRDREYQNIV